MPWNSWPGMGKCVVTVVDPEGKPIPGATVMYYGEEVWYVNGSRWAPGNQRNTFGVVTGTNGVAVIYPYLAKEFPGGGGVYVDTPEPDRANYQEPPQWFYDGLGEYGKSLSDPNFPVPQSPSVLDEAWSGYAFLTMDKPLVLTVHGPGDTNDWVSWTGDVGNPGRHWETFYREVVLQPTATGPGGEDEEGEGCPCAEVTIQDAPSVSLLSSEDFDALMVAEFGEGWLPKSPFTAGTEREWFKTLSPLVTMHPLSAEKCFFAARGAVGLDLAQVLKMCTVQTAGSATADQVVAVMDNQRKLAQVLAEVFNVQVKAGRDFNLQTACIQQRLEMIFQLVQLLGIALFDEGWQDRIAVLRERLGL